MPPGSRSLGVWESVALGILQGLTEFLPVSSSGHLVVVQSFIEGFEQPGVLFDAMVHFGTLLAVVVYFRRDLSGMLRACLPGADEQPASLFGGETVSPGTVRKLVIYLVVATLVTATVGLAFSETIYRLFESVQNVAIMLLVTGALLFLSDHIGIHSRGLKDLRLKEALILGLAQSFALIPGISRSGTTIAVGIFLGLKGEAAARFSFLMAIPAVLGATMLEMRHAATIALDMMVIYALGTIVAAVVGLLTIKLLMFVVGRRNLRYFSYYCWTVALLLFIITTL